MSLLKFPALTDNLHDLPGCCRVEDTVTLQPIRSATRRHHEEPESEIGQQIEAVILEKMNSFSDWNLNQVIHTYQYVNQFKVLSSVTVP